MNNQNLPANANSAEIFTSNWNIYRKIVQHNYMHHLESGRQLTSALAGVNNKNGIAVLDIGCGDASQVAGYANQINLHVYKGYDLSGPALELAAENLKLLPARIELVEGDMQSLLASETGNFDVIFSSFAIHHLQDPGKKELFQHCYQRLNHGGIMIYNDIFRSHAQSREDYLAEYTSNIDKKWHAVNEAEKQLIYDHITNYDYPAFSDECEQWFTGIGFKILNYFKADKWHQMFVLKKPA